MNFNDRWQALMEADADEGAMLREFVYGNGIDEPLIMVNGALREFKMQNDESQIKGKVTAGYGGEVVGLHEHNEDGRPRGWDATHKLRVAALEGGTRKVMNPVAYYAGAAADWLTEQPFVTTKGAKGHEGTDGEEPPIFTMKAMKVMKEMAGMGQPESGKGLSADWGGFTRIDSQAAGFENLRSSAKSADNQDLCNRSRQ